MAEVNPIQVEKYLKGVDYPVSKQDLLKQAKKNGADEQIYATLERLPDEQYEKPTSVSKAIGELNRSAH